MLVSITHYFRNQRNNLCFAVESIVSAPRLYAKLSPQILLLYVSYFIGFYRQTHL